MSSSTTSQIDDLRTLISVFGSGVAEQERGLSAYFVETPTWEELRRDQKNVLLGEKGAGKSALFTLLLADATRDILPEGTIVIGAERPIHIHETALFKEFFLALAETPPPDEILPHEFEFLWKAYFLLLIARELQERGIQNEGAKMLVESLRRLELVPPQDPNPFERLQNALMKVVRVVLRGEGEVKVGTTADPHGAMSSWISLSWHERLQQTSKQKRENAASLENLSQLFESAEWALAHAEPQLTFWLALDRLDDVFPDTDAADIESNALGALLNVYKDLQKRPYDHLRLKIFLRSDIFRRITRDHGFKDLDKIKPKVELKWSDAQLKSLVVLRCAQSERVRALYGLPSSVTEAVQLLRKSREEREELFGKIFPSSIESKGEWANGFWQPSKKRTQETMAWIRGQLADGADQMAPRDVINLVSFAIDGQLAVGYRKGTTRLFTDEVIKSATESVSRDHFETVFRGEQHHLVRYAEALRRGNYEYLLPALQSLWKQYTTSPTEVANVANELVEERFFSKRSTKSSGEAYLVAPLYRSVLELRPGTWSGPTNKDDGKV